MAEANHISYSHQTKHMCDMELLNTEQFLSSHIQGHLTHEEEFTHDEPYGYELSDNPFEPTGNFTYPALILFFGGLFLIHFNFTHFNFIKTKRGEHYMHQRITAGMLEDEIRRIRKEDYPLRYPTSQ